MLDAIMAAALLVAFSAPSFAERRQMLAASEEGQPLLPRPSSVTHKEEGRDSRVNLRPDRVRRRRHCRKGGHQESLTFLARLAV